ncbi:MAG: DUF1971 domain-containing protein [Gammaproteobacteria bacterium]
MRALPDDVAPYKRTPTFTERSVPSGLLRAHTTKEGAWARIVVLEGKLLYRVLQPTITEYVLDPATTGIVEPTVPHEVEPLGAVRFFVEFLRLPQS